MAFSTVSCGHSLTSDAFGGPQLGVGSHGHLVDLPLGGCVRSPMSGGNGLAPLPELQAHGVYATLVPEGVRNFNLALNGLSASVDTLAYDSPLYLTPEPASLMRLVLGGLTMLCCRWCSAR